MIPCDPRWYGRVTAPGVGETLADPWETSL